MDIQKGSKKRKTPLERSFKEGLVATGYSDPVADRIWKWYNPLEK